MRCFVFGAGRTGPGDWNARTDLNRHFQVRSLVPFPLDDERVEFPSGFEPEFQPSEGCVLSAWTTETKLNFRERLKRGWSARQESNPHQLA